jgi:phosphoglycolate phosphatase-like HAD superfamily hydrolase
LPALAVERINRHLKLNLPPGQFIVIGDTPNDILCARHGCMAAVAVGTGRMYSREDLLAHSPDAFLPDLSDTELVLRTFDSL